VIKHRDLSSHAGRVRVGQVYSASAETDVLGLIGKACKEGDARSDDLCLISRVFTTISFDKTEFIRENKGFAIFSKTLLVGFLQKMDGHREE
jgi:hypothetical protein